MPVLIHDPLPLHLVQPTSVSQGLEESTNAGLLEYALDLREAIKRCNADKAALRQIWTTAKQAK